MKVGQKLPQGDCQTQRCQKCYLTESGMKVGQKLSLGKLSTALLKVLISKHSQFN